MSVTAIQSSGPANWYRLPGRGAPVSPLQIMAMRRDPVAWIRDQHVRFGPVVRSRFLNKKMVMLIGPQANEFVLQNHENLFASRPAWEWFIGPFFKNGLMLRDFDEHLQHRRIMQEAFTPEALRDYLELMQPTISRLLAPWDDAVDRLEPLHIFPHMKKLSLDLACEVFAGAPAGAAVDSINQAFVDAVRGCGAVVRYPVPGGLWKRGLRGRRRLEHYFRAALPGKRTSSGTDMFSRFCRARDAHGERFSEEDIVDHMIFLIMAAHDTTNIALNQMLYCLATHQDWQDRCRAEMDAVAPDNLSFEDVDGLVATGLVMKESLRLLAPVPALPRMATRDFDFEGHTVPRGTVVNIFMTYTHHMPEYWTEPERFDPERFAPHRAEDRIRRFVYVPFGGGAHKCLGIHLAGVQVKAILWQLLRRFRFTPMSENYPFTVDRTSLPRPHDDLPLRLERL